MSWLEVKAVFDELPADLSPYIEIFREFSIENTIEEGNSLGGCLVDVAGSQERVAELSARLSNAGANQVIVRDLVEENWEEAWKQFFKPRRVGRQFLVTPTWERVEAQPGEILLLLDPGQAFGTGDHPTTRMCLELLDDMELGGLNVADVGCGSGILGIAAARLGALVSASDIDPLAVEVARENCARNGVDLKLFVGDGLSREATSDLADVPQDETPLGWDPMGMQPVAQALGTPAYDLLISNIISATLIRLAPQAASAVRPGGSWIVSGIIESNWPDVRTAAETSGFEWVSERHEDGWVAARLRRHV